MKSVRNNRFIYMAHILVVATLLIFSQAKAQDEVKGEVFVKCACFVVEDSIIKELGPVYGQGVDQFRAEANAIGRCHDKAEASGYGTDLLKDRGRPGYVQHCTAAQ